MLDWQLCQICYPLEIKLLLLLLLLFSVAFPCKEYIFMKDKAPWRWSKYTLRYITERGVTCLTGKVTLQF